MKELDVLLETYFKSDLSACDEETLTVLERLLDCEDPELLDWLLGHSDPTDTQLAGIVEIIRST
jgi:antitoxin CptB